MVGLQDSSKERVTGNYVTSGPPGTSQISERLVSSLRHARNKSREIAIGGIEKLNGFTEQPVIQERREQNGNMSSRSTMSSIGGDSSYSIGRPQQTKRKYSSSMYDASRTYASVIHVCLLAYGNMQQSRKLTNRIAVLLAHAGTQSAALEIPELVDRDDDVNSAVIKLWDLILESFRREVPHFNYKINHSDPSLLVLDILDRIATKSKDPEYKANVRAAQDVNELFDLFIEGCPKLYSDDLNIITGAFAEYLEHCIQAAQLRGQARLSLIGLSGSAIKGQSKMPKLEKFLEQTIFVSRFHVRIPLVDCVGYVFDIADSVVVKDVLKLKNSSIPEEYANDLCLLLQNAEHPSHKDTSAFMTAKDAEFSYELERQHIRQLLSVASVTNPQHISPGRKVIPIDPVGQLRPIARLAFQQDLPVTERLIANDPVLSNPFVDMSVADIQISAASLDSVLSRRSIDLINTVSLFWRIPPPVRDLVLFELALNLFISGRMSLPTLALSFRFTKDFRAINTDQISFIARRMDYEDYRHLLMSLSVSLQRKIRDIVIDQLLTKPAENLLDYIAFLEKYVYSDSLFGSNSASEFVAFVSTLNGAVKLTVKDIYGQSLSAEKFTNFEEQIEDAVSVYYALVEDLGDKFTIPMIYITVDLSRWQVNLSISDWVHEVLFSCLETSLLSIVDEVRNSTIVDRERVKEYLSGLDQEQKVMKDLCQEMQSKL
ncbi:uncharacterized protein V1516DRAFT_687414 [Lipomyces oligophaga]|uniref:uncharacterized protein n=1 Tax=Lipomyces oligophaga TaxID=45792 RepID=UPI0034CDC9F8